MQYYDLAFVDGDDAVALFDRYEDWITEKEAREIAADYSLSHAEARRNGRHYDAPPWGDNDRLITLPGRASGEKIIVSVNERMPYIGVTLCVDL